MSDRTFPNLVKIPYKAFEKGENLEGDWPNLMWLPTLAGSHRLVASRYAPQCLPDL